MSSAQPPVLPVSSPPAAAAPAARPPARIPSLVIGLPASWRPILPPEIVRKIKKWQMINFALTLLQLSCSIAVIAIISNQLQVVRGVPTSPTAGKWTYSCLLATSEHPQTCQYAYSVASISIFAGFVVSLFQCLTLDCCGMGRVVESMFDLLAAMWWFAGASTITARAYEATMDSMPGQGWREAVVAIAWLASATFVALFVTNFVLTSKLGKAFKEVQAQQAAFLETGGVQLAPTGAASGPPTQGTPIGYPPGAPGAPARGATATGAPVNYPPVA